MRADPAVPTGRDVEATDDAGASGEYGEEARLDGRLAAVPPSPCGCAEYAPAALSPPYVPALVETLRHRVRRGLRRGCGKGESNIRWTAEALRSSGSARDVPIPICGCCNERTLVSMNEGAELLVSADVALSLAIRQSLVETVDQFGLVARDDETTAHGFGFVVDVLDERLCLRECKRSDRS